MSKNQHPATSFKTVIAVLAVVAALVFGTITPASAAEPVHTVTAVTTVTAQAAPAYAPASLNGTQICSTAITVGYKVIYVAAFALGFCPTWGFFQTPWGRRVGVWVTNVACRMPWFVWAATGGRWTTC